MKPNARPDNATTERASRMTPHRVWIHPVRIGDEAQGCLLSSKDRGERCGVRSRREADPHRRGEETGPTRGLGVGSIFCVGAVRGGSCRAGRMLPEAVVTDAQRDMLRGWSQISTWAPLAPEWRWTLVKSGWRNAAPVWLRDG